MDDSDGATGDRTGRSEVAVAAGAEANGGSGAHRIAAAGAVIGGAVAAEVGHTFERTFEGPRVVKYYCAPAGAPA